MPTRFDAIVIGTGQAGPALAARLAGAGMRVAVIERDKFGGTCVNDGCTPTKTMVASAYAAHTASRGGEYGFQTSGQPRVDMKQVKARKDQVVANSSGSVEKWMRGLKGGAVFQGHARFTGPKSIEVNGEILEAEKIFLDVGGRPLVPKLKGIEKVPYLTNQSLMDVDFVPEHLIVVGGSYIGLEFSHMYRRFGSRVTIVEMTPRLVGREDEDVSQAIREILEAEGIDVRTGAECLSVEREGNGVSIGVDCKEGEPRVSGSHLLLAVGRVPNTDDLGLERAGIATDERGNIKVDEGLRTTNPNVWALGDCNGKGAFTHTAYNDYEIVADNLLSNAGRKWTDRVGVYALYIDPPLGRVGMSEAEIRKAGLRARVGKRPMTRVARAIEKGETRGFLKIHVEEGSERILGAALLGTGCDEAVHSLIDAVYARTPIGEFQRRVRIHPTVAELLPTTLESLKPLA
ncbi:MAG TPA: FAD-containing oxidoreductase [Burkholderiales bacterium]|jgi:pyruvate/2-oxoglutarate dehydrogenase complex dihydrolipoamide dehydrogenase (E3) component|nr:FAD-containing oxidoreductase [Burkholderiales bacterium]